MNTRQMRNELMKAYEGQKWRDRVKKMSEGQVYATFTRLKQAGRIK